MEIPNWMSWLRERHYENAPIKEAIIEIQINRPPSLGVANFGRVNLAERGYSERRNLIMGQLRGQLAAGGQLTATTQQDEVGYQFLGGEGKQSVHFRVDGFTFSRLAPYQTWEQLRDESKSLWQIYRDIVGAVTVSQVSLRFVNQLDLPPNLRDFRDYIRSYPEISSDLPQQLATFYLQATIPLPDIDAVLVLNEASGPHAPGSKVVSVVLDINVVRPGLNLESDQGLWDIMEVLRVRKNLIFEGCITNTTRGLIS